MSAPTTGMGLLIIVLFLLPGAVYGLVYERLHGPIPGIDSGMRILRAITVSTLANVLYILFLGSAIAKGYKTIAADYAKSEAAGWQSLVDKAPRIGLLYLLMLIVIPALAAVFFHILGSLRVIQRIPLNLWNASPGAWDTAFTPIPRYVRVLTKDGEWVGGALSEGSFWTNWPAPKEIFIAQAYVLLADGSFAGPRPIKGGVFITCAEARSVEFLVASQPTPP
jgi:hypothetical protein